MLRLLLQVFHIMTVTIDLTPICFDLHMTLVPQSPLLLSPYDGEGWGGGGNERIYRSFTVTSKFLLPLCLSFLSASQLVLLVLFVGDV